jgi:hypothetical protein
VGPLRNPLVATSGHRSQTLSLDKRRKAGKDRCRGSRQLPDASAWKEGKARMRHRQKRPSTTQDPDTRAMQRKSRIVTC